MKGGRTYSILIWIGLAIVCVIPIAAATTSSLLAWRDSVYILGGFAGIFGLVLLTVQPLLAAGLLPGLSFRLSKNFHRWAGGTLVLSVLIHVGALWLTSPPDVVDALLFRSPTQFSNWGVIAMWALFASAFFAVFRKSLRLRFQIWRKGHKLLATLIVVGTVAHALLIEGTMETITKYALCAFVLIVTFVVLLKKRAE